MPVENYPKRIIFGDLEKEGYLNTVKKTCSRLVVSVRNVVIFCTAVRPSMPPAPQRPWIILSEPVKNKPVGKHPSHLTYSSNVMTAVCC